MPQLLVARAPTPWRHLLITVLAVAAHLALGLLAMTFRIARVIVNVAAEAAIHAERTLAQRTGRPALSQTGIAALAVAFVAEFRTVYHQPTTR